MVIVHSRVVMTASMWVSMYVPISIIMSVKTTRGINHFMKREGGYGDWSVVAGCSSNLGFTFIIHLLLKDMCLIPFSSPPTKFYVVKVALCFPSWLCMNDGVIKWDNFPHYWPFVWEIHRPPVNSPHKGQWRWALMFSFICAWRNGWVNNCEAGDSRRRRAYYDATVMALPFRVASIPAVRYDLVRGLSTCLQFIRY